MKLECRINDEGAMTNIELAAISRMRHYSIVKERRGRLREEANTVGCSQRRPTGGIRRREGDFGREISDFWRLAEGVAGEGVVALRIFGNCCQLPVGSCQLVVAS